MKFEINYSNIAKSLFLIFVISILGLSIVSIAEASAATPKWPGDFLSPEAGGVDEPIFDSFQLTVTVKDLTESGAGSIPVRITSSADPVGFDLILNEGPLGTFTNTNLALMEQDAFATETSVITITIDDDSDPTPLIDPLPFPPIFIMSDTDRDGITPNFTETGNHTNVFTATVTFGDVTDKDTDTLAVSPGDVFTVFDISSNHVNGFVIPNQKDGRGAILVEILGTVTATYKGDSSSFQVTPYDSPGRVSGGLVRPGLVLDSSSGPSDSGDSGGGGCVNCTPPTLGLNSDYKRIVEHGFSFNDNPVDVEYHYTPYPLITAKVGEENKIVLKIFDDGGTQNIEHVGLAFGLGKDQFFSESKATINLDRTLDGKEETTTYDPENVLDNVKIVTSKDQCNINSKIQCLKVTIHQTFRDVLEFNMVSTNVWDSKKNAWQNFYNHGIEITGESLNPPKTKLVAFGEKNMRGLYELTEIDKKRHLWIDEFDNIYEFKGNDRFDRMPGHKISRDFDKITSHGCDRTCNWFTHYKLNQKILAQNTFDRILAGKSIEGAPPAEPFSYTYQIVNRADDPELQKSIAFEKIRAEKILKQILNP